MYIIRETVREGKEKREEPAKKKKKKDCEDV